MTQHMEDVYADEIWRGTLTPGDPANESAENLKVVSRIWDEMWNLGNFDNLEAVFAADYWGHLPMMDVHGPEQFKGLVTAYRVAYPDVHLTIDDIFATGDRLAVRWTSRGTHLGEMMGMPASGNRIEIMGISLFRVADGKVAEEWEGFDTLKMMQQLGAIPKLG